MRRKSHICLGHYLIAQYMNEQKTLQKKLFIFGCFQPDINPFTYLKGSLRFRWLRGHNYQNAHRFMGRISQRLEQRRQLTTLDYYTLGKLIHYTADAFTAAHNTPFPTSLSNHRKYEIKLQNQFLPYLQQLPVKELPAPGSIMAGIVSYHSLYTSCCYHSQTDCIFVLHACCCAMSVLFS